MQLYEADGFKTTEHFMMQQDGLKQPDNERWCFPDQNRKKQGRLRVSRALNSSIIGESIIMVIFGFARNGRVFVEFYYMTAVIKSWV